MGGLPKHLAATLMLLPAALAPLALALQPRADAPVAVLFAPATPDGLALAALLQAGLLPLAAGRLPGLWLARPDPDQPAPGPARVPGALLTLAAPGARGCP